jgi:GT2 family glycosyltransferase
VVPTLGNPLLGACIASLERQTFKEMEIVIVDNSGRNEARRLLPPETRARIIGSPENRGFGGAVNLGFLEYPAEYLATLNDDAEASPKWMESLVNALDSDPAAGMAASLVALAGTGEVDSAGMLIARDGTSKQRGHGDAVECWREPGETLCPSGSAAIYREAMLQETGLFEEDFFLYCEDTDLGLRGRWAGWRCLYLPEARVEHRYSASAGAASSLKAWLVERNRLRLAVRCLPLAWLFFVPAASLIRYFWHAVSMLDGRGKAAEYARSGGGVFSLMAMVIRAHFDLALNWSGLWRERRRIQRVRVSSAEMGRILGRSLIGLREVARL